MHHKICCYILVFSQLPDILLGGCVKMSGTSQQAKHGHQPALLILFRTFQGCSTCVKTVLVHLFCALKINGTRAHRHALVAPNNYLSVFRLTWATLWKRWDSSGTGWFKPRWVRTTEVKKKKESLRLKMNKSEMCFFVPFISGTVSLLLQSLAGCFTGNFTASRQPVATGQSQRPQSSLNVSATGICKAQAACADQSVAAEGFTNDTSTFDSCSFNQL